MKKRSAKEIRDELSIKFVYLKLMISLTPKGITNQEVQLAFNETAQFLEKGSDHEVLNKGPSLLSIIQVQIDDYKKKFPPKVPLEKIAQEYINLYKTKTTYSAGVEFGWLQDLMDCTKIGYPRDLPYQARIGLGRHAGSGNVEELFLLRDAFFFLELADQSLLDLKSRVEYYKQKRQDVSDLSIKEVQLQNHNVCAYSRLSVLSFFSFVEAFVNSVGYDFLKRNESSLSESDKEILQGKKKARYLALENKIEKFPSIIRLDKKSPIVISDKKQIKEPFKTFVAQVKLLRDSSVHFSPLKEPIWFDPSGWLDKARSASRLCLEVSLEFWNACYPNRGGPVYLDHLNYDKNIELAKERLLVQTALQRARNT